MKVAIIHDQLTQYGGAEKTLEALLDIFPQADIFTGFSRPQNVSRKILDHKITTGRFNLNLGFLLPLIFESFDLTPYDVVISEGTAWPKGVLTSTSQLHISYIYTPPRFLYGYATEGQKREVWYLKPFLAIVDHFLRLWDFAAAQRPDFILTISNEVAKRVQKFYGRGSRIIYPPVEMERSGQSQIASPADRRDRNDGGGYYLCVSRLAAYKNIDLLIEAFNQTDLKLVVAGTGKEEARLKKLAQTRTETLTKPTVDAQPKNVELLGFVSEEEKRRLLSECKGFVLPTNFEDFGIVVAEALSFGKPVLCHRSGGPMEIVEEGVTGMFFDELSPNHLAEKIKEFDRKIETGGFDNQVITDSAQKFSRGRFVKEFGDFVQEKWEEKCRARTA